MAYSSPPPPRQPPPPSPPPPPLQQQPDHDTTLTLALPPPPLPYALISPKPDARRPRPEGATAALARVRSSPTGDTPPCTECGKRFPSWKALFGHMRCHPERQWRGITPPPHFRHGRSASATASASQFSLQEREVAASLLLLAGALPGAGKGKKSPSAASPSAIESCGTSASAAPGPARSDDHKCSVCDRWFASGQALGGHKRCHWERTCAEVVMIATAGSSGSAISEVAAAAKATVLDLNLPPPRPPLVRKSDQGSSLNEMLDLKLGY